MNPLSRFDDVSLTPADLPPLLTAIPNGYYTLTFPDGSHQTFRVHRQRDSADFAPGTRIISILVGPENTDDYERFGFVNEEGIQVWKRYARRGESSPESKHERYARIVWALATGGEMDGFELMISRRCLICNHHLTDPDSISRGVGPGCWRRYFNGK